MATDFLTVIEVIRPKHWTQNLHYQHPSHNSLQFLICLMHISDISSCFCLHQMTSLWCPWITELGTFRQCQSSENIIQRGPELASEHTILITLLQSLVSCLNWISTTSSRISVILLWQKWNLQKPQHRAKYHIKRLKLHDKSGIEQRSLYVCWQRERGHNSCSPYQSFATCKLWKIWEKGLFRFWIQRAQKT